MQNTCKYKQAEKKWKDKTQSNFSIIANEYSYD